MKSIVHNLKFSFISYPLLIHFIRSIIFITMTKLPVQKHIKDITMSKLTLFAFNSNSIKPFV